MLPCYWVKKKQMSEERALSRELGAQGASETQGECGREVWG